MKLLQTMAGAPVGGAEGFFERLAVGLAARGTNQSFVVRPDTAREALLSGTGAAVETAPFGGFLDISIRRTIANVIRRQKPDIVLSWMNRATSHCPESTGADGFIHIGTPRGYYDPKYYRKCDHLVVTTDDLQNFYCEAGWLSERVSVVPNFVPDLRKPAIARSEFETPDDVPLLLALGRLHKNKGFDILIQAMTALPDHFLWIGGTGPLEQMLKDQAKALNVENRLRFLGWQDDTAPLFAAADMFVCSSRHEPFGNIIIEAWMQETPIVAIDSEGPGALIQDGNTGVLTRPEDPDALAAAIGSLSRSPNIASALMKAGRNEYEQLYSEDVIVPRYISLFERLTG